MQWGQSAPLPVHVPAGGGSDPKTMAMLAHLLAIFVGWLGPLIIYLVDGGKDRFVRHHAAESLNFQLTTLIAALVCIPLMFVLIGFVLLPVVLIGALVFEIMGAVAANRGEWWKYPINIRMVSGAVG